MAQGGTCSIHDRDSYRESKQIHEPEILYPKKIPGNQNFLPKKIHIAEKKFE